MSNRERVNLLVTTPQLSRSGGVAMLLKVLRLNDFDGIDYMTVQGGNGFLIKSFSMIALGPRFLYWAWGKDCIQINPSMNRNSFLRDAFLVTLSFILRKRVVVYWHGWNNEFFDSLVNSRFKNFIFHSVYLNCNHHIVLSKVFKKALLNRGAEESKVHIFHNAAEPLEKSEWNKNGEGSFRVLFLSRLERGKGLDVVMNTIGILQKRINVRLDVVGDGSLFQSMKQKAQDIELKNFEFHGHLVGEKKAALLRSAHILFQPSSYSEGMPLTILEAMFNGALIAARPVGGIPECLSKDYSILLDSDDPKIWADEIENYWKDQGKWKKSIDHNYKWACENATPDVLRAKLFKLYEG
jgi:glycosyltransferase involved in cell wall biosynthesis